MSNFDIGILTFDIIHTMPRKHAADKALRQSHKARVRNVRAVSAIKKLRKEVLHGIESGKLDPETLRKTISAIGRAAAHGVIKPNASARLISRLQRKVNAIKK